MTRRSSCQLFRTDCRLLLILLLVVVAFLVSWPAVCDGDPVYSSCQFDSPWRKGSGEPIKSFLRSVVVYSTLNPLNPKLYALFRKGHRDLVTLAEHSRPGALAWRKYGLKTFDGWLYGNFDNVHRMTGMEGRDVFYLYEDLKTALRGTFVNGTMLEGRQVKVKGFRCKSGLLQLQFTFPSPSAPVFFFEPATADGFITSQPTVRDPYDARNVYIGQSSLGAHIGQGIFARRNMRAGSLVTYYAGALLYDYADIIFDNMTVGEREHRHKNLLTFNDDYDLDCPEDDIVKYRATLAHKSNHAFDANTKFCFVKHPKFGEIRGLEAIRNIRRGDEIYVDYKYSLDSNYVPRWYAALFDETTPKNEKKKERKGTREKAE